MKILLRFLLLLTIISGCSTVSPVHNLKSPCVATDNGTPGPCIKRSVNDHWLT